MNLYEKLEVYQRSYKMTVSLYKYTETLPKEERYAMASQIRRAIMSIPLNIAEGYGKEDSSQEIKRFLKMAKGSCSEVNVLLDLCKDIGYMEEKAYKRYKEEIEVIAKMLYKLVQSIK